MSELQEYWIESIRLNNLGVRYLQQGMLQQAEECFREASEYCEEASYESSVDGFGMYPNHWVSLSEAFPSVAAYTDSCETVMKPLHPAALSIGEQSIPKDTFVPDTERRRAVLTSRLDWIIDFNLATTLQLCGLVGNGSTPSPDSSSQMKYLREAFSIFSALAEDTAEWSNYAASVDIAIFLAMMFQNQRIICMYLGKGQHASVFFMRIRHIQQAIGSMLLLYGNSCLNGAMQRISLSAFNSDHCAPSA